MFGKNHVYSYFISNSSSIKYYIMCLLYNTKASKDAITLHHVIKTLHSIILEAKVCKLVPWTFITWEAYKIIYNRIKLQHRWLKINHNEFEYWCDIYASPVALRFEILYHKFLPMNCMSVINTKAVWCALMIVTIC